LRAAQRQVSIAANASLTTLHWQVGHRVRTEALEGRRAEYGEQVVVVLGRQLETRYGRGFGEKSLRHMIRFAETFPNPEIVSALRRQLSWSHFKQLIYLPDDLKRNFYAEMCRTEGWSTRVLGVPDPPCAELPGAGLEPAWSCPRGILSPLIGGISL
jgi:hypothetical protein